MKLIGILLCAFFVLMAAQKGRRNYLTVKHFGQLTWLNMKMEWFQKNTARHLFNCYKRCYM